MISCGDSHDSTSGVILNAKYICPDNCDKSEQGGVGVCTVCNKSLVKKIKIEGIPMSGDLSTYSLYQLKSDWTNQDNKKLKLNAFSGGLVLTTMIFTNCDYACPTIMGDIMNIEDALSKEAKNKLKVVVVTMDPETDTPKVLKEYASQFDVNESRWSLLTGSKDNIYLFSKILDLGYKKFENGMYGHANIVTLLNEKGEIIYQQEGLKKNNKEFVRLIEGV